ncbi:conserved hypothetical protein [Perkinsus marinus ATCC 50983]|uniref:Calcineurin-like phosphoesterase domain-containing protein n=1 Tax=Perkinsus marinus (strain ATCC 50983 / TXsc) TaxID=423536 RepID=C5L0P1_PERM5|nr:conserved hypothetical protein [Perkinsus marinus ATCC 50983]EER09693.1 conserved hypothetical protein [Perkinsus marinus ATCC 50983]|eukprot:XP_002777898.1 conserved hypothetical protein [Perkinsus marinus ATCC 50983]
MIACSLLLSILSYSAIYFVNRRYVLETAPPLPKDQLGPNRSKYYWAWSALVVVINAWLCLVILVAYVLLGAFIFGDLHAWIFYVVALVVYIIYTLLIILIRNKASSCCRWSLGVLGYLVALQCWYTIQIPTMWSYTKLVWLVGIAASVPLMIKVAHTFGRRSIRSLFRNYKFYVAEILTLGIGILLTYLSAGSCVAVYNPQAPGWWIPLEGTLFWSSRLFRSFGRRPCPNGQRTPCHVYLTAAQNLSNSMFVNVHTSTSIKSIYVKYSSHKDDNTIGGVIGADNFEVPHLDEHDQRHVFAAYLPDLLPDAVVSFNLMADGDLWPQNYTFRTSPLNGEVKFVIGGDTGTSDVVEDINSHIGPQSPLFAVNGGDVAYDNGMFPCACTWDLYLWQWSKVKTSDGHMIPLIFAIGNHDIGANHDNHGAINSFIDPNRCDNTKRESARPLFIAYFPFEAVDGKAPEICDRKVNHVHTAGTAVTIWSLDSLYAGGPLNAVHFVEDNMPNMKDQVNHFGVYHVPMYSSYKEDDNRNEPMKRYWPSMMFDKYYFKVCYEHHAHTFKRTMPMINNSIATNGVIYVGDGKWGTSGPILPTVDSLVTSDHLVKSGIDHHVWYTIADSNGKISLTAVDHNNNVIDHVESLNSTWR